MSFSFPQDQRKSEWLKPLQMTVAGNHICSTHFSDESFNYTPFGERKCLKRIAVPMFSEPKILKGRVYYPGDIDSSRLFCNKEEENAFLITKKALDAARKEIISLKAKNKSQELLITAHSGAKSKIYEQKYLNYSCGCKNKYEVKFFQIGGGVGGKS